MSLLICLLLSTYPAPPSSRWQVSFKADIALVLSDGVSVFFAGNQLYTYDPVGNPLLKNSLEFEPALAFVGPEGFIWVHDGEGLLGRLNSNYNLAWQRELAPPTLTPFVFSELAVYVAGQDIFLLDPREGQARYSRRSAVDVRSIVALESWLLLSHGQDEVLAWDPVQDLEEVRYEGKNSDVSFAVPGPPGELALVQPWGRLAVMTREEKPRWHRMHRIDIAVPPVWLPYKKKQQLIVATHGRRIYAYGHRGEILAQTLVSARIQALIPFWGNRILAVPQHHDELVWYDGNSCGFLLEPLKSKVRLLAHRGDFVLLVQYDDMIKLFRSSSP